MRDSWCRVAILAGFALGMAVPSLGRAEEKQLEVGRWYPTLESGLNITQSGYSDNWNGGDRGSIVWTLITNGTLENQIHPKVNWSNALKLAYGQTHRQARSDDGRRYWDAPEKSTDLIDLETVFRFTLGGFVDPFASARFESQFQDASDPAGRTLALNPLKFKESAGIARKFINEEERSLLSRLGLTLRQSQREIFIAEAPDPATQGELTTDGGLELVTDYKNKIMNERVAWTSKLSFYQPFFVSAQSDFDGLSEADLAAIGDPDVADYTQTMDIDWENIFTTQITKLVSVNLYLRWLYDKYDNTVVPVFDGSATTLQNPGEIRTAIRKAGQFKQTLSIGVTYRFL